MPIISANGIWTEPVARFSTNNRAMAIAKTMKMQVFRFIALICLLISHSHSIPQLLVVPHRCNMQVWMKKLYQVAQQPVGTPAYFLKVGRAVHFAAIDLFCLVRFQISASCTRLCHSESLTASTLANENEPK